MREKDKELCFRDSVDKDLFLMQYNESAKVIDFYKAQQWYATGLAVGINYGIINIYSNYLDKVSSTGKILIIILMAIISFLIVIIGPIILYDLFINANRHRRYVKISRNAKHLKVPEELKEIFTPDKDLHDIESNCQFFFILFVLAVIMSSLIALIIIGQHFFFIFELFKQCLGCI